MTKARQGFAWRLAALFAVGDLAAIWLAFIAAALIAHWVRGLLGFDAVPLALFWDQQGRDMTLLSVLAIGVFAFGGLYRRSSWELSEIKRVFGGVALVALFDVTLQYLIREHDSRLWFAFAYPLAAFMVIATRMLIRSHPRLKEAMTSHVVLIGGGVTPDLLVRELRENRSGPVRLLRHVELPELNGMAPGALGAELDRIAESEGAPSHRLLTILAPTAEELERAQGVIERLNEERRPYDIVLPFHGLARHGLHLQDVIGADMILAEMKPVGERPEMYAVKRVFDLVVGGVALVLASPVMLGVSAVLLLQGGPVLFSQKRVGRDGARFNCLKFRTMRPDAEARLRELLAQDPEARREWAEFQKLSCDPRVTGFGAFLRATSLDELPQLINVMRGEMSLVGPRPIVAPEVEGYDSDHAYYKSPEFAYYRRCTPGITGLWQVSGRADTSHEERVRLDRWYYRNWSIWLDILVLFKTVGAVLRRHGSR